jgi:hypothetical protein
MNLSINDILVMGVILLIAFSISINNKKKEANKIVAEATTETVDTQSGATDVVVINQVGEPDSTISLDVKTKIINKVPTGTVLYFHNTDSNETASIHVLIKDMNLEVSDTITYYDIDVTDFTATMQ